MINTKNLSLRFLKSLKKVEVEPVRRTMAKQTFERIPKGCWQRFRCEDHFNMATAYMAVTHLNKEAGWKEWVVTPEEEGKVVNVYHMTRISLMLAEVAREKEKNGTT